MTVQLGGSAQGVYYDAQKVVSMCVKVSNIGPD